MNTAIPDFSESEQKLVSVNLFERYGKLILFLLADSELQIDATSPRRSSMAQDTTSTTAFATVS
jgi:hypothetical protein